ncbi:MAG: DegT/DnrJ/EryC1/StrS family aminotransferase [Acidobacteriaceae bacterium]
MDSTQMRIPLASPEIAQSDIDAVVNVLRTSQLSLGPRMEEFERAMASYVGAAYAVAVNSGTSGLHLCVRALGIGEGDEVIVPSFTFIAAANVVRLERATPIFVDIDPATLNLDPTKVERAITRRTRALMVVHTFGRPAEMAALLAIARRHKLLVIEDACEAIGAEHHGQKVGTLGDAAVFAFYPNKQITTGEGGMIVTNDMHLAATARSLRNQGRGNPGEWLEHTTVGYNYRLSEMNSALGLAQLSRIEDILALRAEIAGWYDENLHENKSLVLPAIEMPHCRISWFVYVVRLSSRYRRQQRDTIIRKLAEQGIGCGRYFAPIHLQPAYSDLATSRHKLPVTEAAGEHCIALPFFTRIARAQLQEVCEALAAAIRDEA